jgi:hypothetical protein
MNVKDDICQTVACGGRNSSPAGQRLLSSETKCVRQPGRPSRSAARPPFVVLQNIEGETVVQLHAGGTEDGTQ